MNKLDSIAEIHDNNTGKTIFLFYRCKRNGKMIANRHVGITVSSYNRLMPRLEAMVCFGEFEQRSHNELPYTVKQWIKTPLYEAHKRLYV